MLLPYLLFWRFLSYFSKEELLTSSLMGEFKPEGCRAASPPMWYGAALLWGNSRNRNLGLPNQCMFEFYWTWVTQLKRTGNDGDTAPKQGSDTNSDEQHRATATECDSSSSSWKFMACPTARMPWTGKRVLHGAKFIPCMWIWGWTQSWLLCLDLLLILLSWL